MIHKEIKMESDLQEFFEVEEIDGMLSYMIESMRIRALKAEHNDSSFDSTSRKSPPLHGQMKGV